MTNDRIYYTVGPPYYHVKLVMIIKRVTDVSIQIHDNKEGNHDYKGDNDEGVAY
jgi:hypothetical protein